MASKLTEFAIALPGIIFDYAGTAAPNGFLLCAGQAVSRATYSQLFAILGTLYGVGDGSTTFNIPDLRGRVAAGDDNMGGTTAGRITAAGAGFDGTVLGGVGGSETHTLTVAQIPAHSHTQVATQTPSAGASGNPMMSTSSSGTGAAGTTQNTGTGNAHPNVQPTMILNKIIKT